MIPSGRKAVRVDESAAQFGVSVRTWTRRARDPEQGRSWPAIISSAHAPLMLADKAQVRALLLGRMLPPLPTEPSDGDLLDRHEAVSILTHHSMSIRSWTNRSINPKDALPGPDQVIHGIAHWHRRTVRTWDEAGPQKATGRPSGARDSYQRQTIPASQHAEAALRDAKILADLTLRSDHPTAREVAEHWGMSRSTVLRIARQARESKEPPR